MAGLGTIMRGIPKWNERTPEGKRRKQMAQVNLEIVLNGKDESLSRIAKPAHLCYHVDTG